MITCIQLEKTLADDINGAVKVLFLNHQGRRQTNAKESS